MTILKRKKLILTFSFNRFYEFFYICFLFKNDINERHNREIKSSLKIYRKCENFEIFTFFSKLVLKNKVILCRNSLSAIIYCDIFSKRNQSNYCVSIYRFETN